MTGSLPRKMVDIRPRRDDEISMSKAAEVLDKLEIVEWARLSADHGKPVVRVMIVAGVARRQLRAALMDALGVTDIIVTKTYQCEPSLVG